MDWTEASFYEAHGDAIKCTLCPHACELADGDVGTCHVRRRKGSRVETATWATSVQHFQPIERKPLYHFRPGIEVLTIAAPGCSLACHYCQNWRISQFGRIPGVEWSAEKVSPLELVTLASQRDRAIALSYSEPGLAAELTLAIAELARPVGVDVIWKTNGFLTQEATKRLVPCLSAMNLDLKAADTQSHRRLTGVPLEPIHEFLDYVVSEGVWVEVSTPLIPGVNNDAASLRGIAERIASCSPDIPWHLLRFTPEFRMAELRPTYPRELAMAVEIARDVGLNFVYVERALGARARNTYCPQCQTEVASREIQGIRELNLPNGMCGACGISIPGRWDRMAPSTLNLVGEGLQQ